MLRFFTMFTSSFTANSRAQRDPSLNWRDQPRPSGRGGIGNIKISRDPSKHSDSPGGTRNIKTSPDPSKRSDSPSGSGNIKIPPDPFKRSVSPGGTGNIKISPEPSKCSESPGGTGNIKISPEPSKRSDGPGGFFKKRFKKRPRPSESPSPRKVSSYGRGGSGNSRVRQADEPARRPGARSDLTPLETQYLLARGAWRAYEPRSSARGGAGNVVTPGPIAEDVQVLVSVTKD